MAIILPKTDETSQFHKHKYVQGSSVSLSSEFSDNVFRDPHPKHQRCFINGPTGN